MMLNRELKNLELKLSEMGVTNNSNIIVEIGKAHQEGIFELKISMIKLNDVPVQDEVLFDKQHLFKMLIEPQISVVELKKRICDEFNKDKG